MAQRLDLPSTLRQLAGKRSDWLPEPRRPRVPKPGLHLVGPIAIMASVAASWFAFEGATGEEGSVAFGLFIGATSILLMAWSFVLALRAPVLEPVFGGLDRMYRVHRWAGVGAIIAMFLHTSVEPEIEGGIRGASKSLADQAEGLASTGETMLYILVAISLLRWFPYRWWRWTHKLLGIPFAFACWHFYTAEKPYANGSGWGWWFGTFMVLGLAAYLGRVVVRDMLLPGRRYVVSSAEKTGSTLDLRLSALDEPLSFRAGQFVVLKVQQDRLQEPHIFTIASAPDDPELRFFIRELGDWTSHLHRADLEGARVVVEGPYGRFEPFDDHHEKTVWVAGGVGITPFLATTAELAEDERDVTLIYCVRSRADAMALPDLERAAARGQLNLVLCASEEGHRFDLDVLREHAGDLSNAHVAVCGPAGLIRTVEEAARELGASGVEREDFDIRQGFGPDLPDMLTRS